MTKPTTPPPGVDAHEWALRMDLAACYRLIALYGMDDTIYTHISARLPGDEHHFLINPYGMLFEEITASSLVVIDLNGEKVRDSQWDVNPAGFTIHSAIHGAREDALCVLHTHTLAGMAVAAQEEGLLPLNQMSLEFYRDLAYHDYEGIALELDERARLVADLGARGAMILRHHGLLTVGRSIAEAFYRMYYLEMACRIQVATRSTGQPLIIPSKKVCDHTFQQFQRGDGPKGERLWPALLRKLDRVSPDFRR